MEKHTRELACGLAAEGITLTLVGATQHLQGLPEAIRTIAINTARSRHSPALLLRILRLIRSGQFEVVHAQGTKAAFVIQRLAPLIRHCRRIATVHGFKSRYPNARAFDRLIAVSRTLAESIDQPGVSVIYNGVTLPPTQPARLPETEPPIWLAAGRLVPVKGFHHLIKAFRGCPGSLLIAGAGPEKKELQRLIEATHQQKRVHLLGHREDVTALMQSADGVIISSEREGFSYVCAEALLSSKPVISTDVPIANELIPRAQIIDLSKPETLAACLRTPPHRLLEAQQEARAMASQKLTVDAMTTNTLKLYRDATQHEH